MSHPRIEPTKDKGWWRLLSSHTVQLLEGQVTVPEGYVTNGATIPRILWTITGHPLSTDFIEPALVHDYLCERAEQERSYQGRVWADATFLYLLVKNNVPAWKSILMYYTVRINGWITFWRVWWSNTFSAT